MYMRLTRRLINMDYMKPTSHAEKHIRMFIILLPDHIRKHSKFCILALSIVYISLQFCVIHNQQTSMIYSSFNPDEEQTICTVTSGKPLCHPTRHLVGPVRVNTTALPWAILNEQSPTVKMGGRWKPRDCQSCNHVAIVIPYRDRDAHLRTFLGHMHPILQRQQLDYGIYVIEQDNLFAFNRGMLMNIGFLEALKTDNYSCFVFSDVDLLPEDDRNIYGCPTQPTHLSVSIDSHGYKLFYPELFGGVENFRTEQFQAINGFSNMYFGWGGEDDDLYNRIIHKGFRLNRPPVDIGRYTMNRHISMEKHHSGMNVLHEWKWRLIGDGISSLRYKVIRKQSKRLYTLITVAIDQHTIKQDWSEYTRKDYLLKTLITREFA